MNLSVFYLYVIKVAEQEKISIDDALEYAKGIGYNALDVDVDDLKADPHLIEKIKGHGFTVQNVYGEYDVLNGKYDDAFELIDYADICGAPIAMLLPGDFGVNDLSDEMKCSPEKMISFLNSDKRVSRAVESIRKTAKYAKSKGITLTIESYGCAHSLTSYTSQIEWLLDSIDDLRFTFDVGNFYINGEDIPDAFRKLSDKTVHVHCKDYLLTPARTDKDFSLKRISTPVGGGYAPTKKIVDDLLEMGYKGAFTVEYLGTDDAARVIKESIEYMKTLF